MRQGQRRSAVLPWMSTDIVERRQARLMYRMAVVGHEPRAQRARRTRGGPSCWGSSGFCLWAETLLVQRTGVQGGYA
jgi:hypothetical protein